MPSNDDVESTVIASAAKQSIGPALASSTMDCFVVAPRSDGYRSTVTTVIPDVQLHIVGCDFWCRPGIHNHGRGLWIPGSMLRIAPE